MTTDSDPVARFFHLTAKEFKSPLSRKYAHLRFEFFAAIAADVEVVLHERHEARYLVTAERGLGELIEQCKRLAPVSVVRKCSHK